MTPVKTQEFEALKDEVRSNRLQNSIPAIISTVLTALGVGGAGLYSTNNATREGANACNAQIITIAHSVSQELARCKERCNE